MRGALPVIRMLTWFEAHDSAGHAVTGTGPPSQPFSLRPVSPRSPLAAQQRAPALQVRYWSWTP